MDQLNPLILVVEDDDDGRETICALVEIGGYATAQVRNGQEALNYLHSNPPPFVIGAQSGPDWLSWVSIGQRSRRCSIIPRRVTSRLSMIATVTTARSVSLLRSGIGTSERFLRVGNAARSCRCSRA
jgi:ActR/RegA family two-component response regulator